MRPEVRRPLHMIGRWRRWLAIVGSLMEVWRRVRNGGRWWRRYRHEGSWKAHIAAKRGWWLIAWQRWHRKMWEIRWWRRSATTWRWLIVVGLRKAAHHFIEVQLTHAGIGPRFTSLHTHHVPRVGRWQQQLRFPTFSLSGGPLAGSCFWRLLLLEGTAPVARSGAFLAFALGFVVAQLHVHAFDVVLWHFDGREASGRRRRHGHAGVAVVCVVGRRLPRRRRRVGQRDQISIRDRGRMAVIHVQLW